MMKDGLQRGGPQRRWQCSVRKKARASRWAREAWAKDPDLRSRVKAYQQRPDVKARRKAYMRRYMRRYMREKRKKVGEGLRRHLPQLIADQDGTCPGCGQEIGFNSETHVDHIVPVAKGGTSDVANLQALCAACNMRKWTKDWESWKEQG